MMYECPVCFEHKRLQRIGRCQHKICVDCARKLYSLSNTVYTSGRQNKWAKQCPICRRNIIHSRDIWIIVKTLGVVLLHTFITIISSFVWMWFDIFPHKITLLVGYGVIIDSVATTLYYVYNIPKLHDI